MDVIERNGSLGFTIPVHPWLRVAFVVVGVFVVSITAWELGRGVWPLNLTSPFFAIIIAGAWLVGGAAALAGLFGWSASWRIRRDEINIALQNPFTRKRIRLGQAEVARIEVVEKEAMEGANTWAVSVLSTSGRRFETFDFPNEAAAERLRGRIVSVFRG